MVTGIQQQEGSIHLDRYLTPAGYQWALCGKALSNELNLGKMLELPRGELLSALDRAILDEKISGDLVAPIEPNHEVWACGVTYMRSREARQLESIMGDIYTQVYEAERPEIFFKSLGWRVSGHAHPIRIRKDSRWNAPEPEFTLVVNCHGQIIGYCAGNDVSSRDIEGENPLYLPQAKIYSGSCALGPGIKLVQDENQMENIPIQLEIFRNNTMIYQGDTNTTNMKRSFSELVGYLFRELEFPKGVFLMTGTGIVPLDDFSLESGDLVRTIIDDLVLENTVAL